ncbi:MAG: hypothetical protein ACLQQ4_04735 [Bacteroidia bacterium]
MEEKTREQISGQNHSGVILKEQYGDSSFGLVSYSKSGQKHGLMKLYFHGKLKVQEYYKNGLLFGQKKELP